MTTFAIPMNSLRAAMSIAPAKDIRYYLVGVYVDTSAGKIVATDGHKLFVCYGPTAPVDPFIIPLDDLARVLKSFPATYNRGRDNACEAITVSVTKTDGKVWLTMEGYAGAKFTFTAVDGRYPDYTRVIPQVVGPMEFAVYNAAYLAEAFDAIAIYRNKSAKDAEKHECGLMMQGPSAGIVTDGQADSMVLVMPMRSNIGRQTFTDALILAHRKLPGIAAAA